jgi:hypothetical protein
MTPAQWLASIEEARRADVAALHALITKAAPKLAPAVTGKLLGYGAYHYRYDSGREGDSFKIAMASGKSGISVYVSAVDDDGVWLAEKARPKLGKASVGKSCIRFAKLADLDRATLTDVIKRAAKMRAPGEV